MPTCACGAYMQPEEWPYHCLHCPDATLAGRRTQLTDTGAQPRQRPTQPAIGTQKLYPLYACCGGSRWGAKCTECGSPNPNLQTESPLAAEGRGQAPKDGANDILRQKEAS